MIFLQYFVYSSILFVTFFCFSILFLYLFKNFSFNKQLFLDIYHLFLTHHELIFPFFASYYTFFTNRMLFPCKYKKRLLRHTLSCRNSLSSFWLINYFTYYSLNNAVDRYLSPESGSNTTIFLPLFSGL